MNRQQRQQQAPVEEAAPEAETNENEPEGELNEQELETPPTDYFSEFQQRVETSRHVLKGILSKRSIDARAQDVLGTLGLLHVIEEFNKPNILLTASTTVSIPEYGKNHIDYTEIELENPIAQEIINVLDQTDANSDITPLRIEILKLVHSSVKPELYDPTVFYSFKASEKPFDPESRFERAKQHDKYARPNKRRKLAETATRGTNKQPIVVNINPNENESTSMPISTRPNAPNDAESAANSGQPPTGSAGTVV